MKNPREMAQRKPVSKRLTCTKNNCKFPAVSVFKTKRNEKSATLSELTSETILPFNAVVYCKKHSNLANVPLGWEFTKTVREFAEFEIEKDKNALTQVLEPRTINHPVYSKKHFPDDELTQIMSLRRTKKPPVIPEERAGTRIGNLVAVRANGEEND